LNGLMILFVGLGGNPHLVKLKLRLSLFAKLLLITK
jgi:hypothetical protein